MTLVDALLVCAAALGAFGLTMLAVVKNPRRRVFWLVGTLYGGFWTNVLFWRLDAWSLWGVVVGFLGSAAVVGGWVVRDWQRERLYRQIEERRRAHYRDYPFNQWKPADVDEPIDS